MNMRYAPLGTLLACCSVMARDGRPGCPCGKSTSSATFRPTRSKFCARRVDLAIMLLILTIEAGICDPAEVLRVLGASRTRRVLSPGARPAVR